MLLVAPVVKSKRIATTPEQDKLFGIEKLNVVRSEIPAVTHVDYSARIQTVTRDNHPRTMIRSMNFIKRPDAP